MYMFPATTEPGQYWLQTKTWRLNDSSLLSFLEFGSNESNNKSWTVAKLANKMYDILAPAWAWANTKYAFHRLHIVQAQSEKWVSLRGVSNDVNVNVEI